MEIHGIWQPHQLQALWPHFKKHVDSSVFNELLKITLTKSSISSV